MNETRLESIFERFNYAFDAIRERDGLTVAALARVLGVRRSSLYRCRATGVIRPEWLSILCLTYGTSADWLLTGRGTVFGRS